MTQVNMLALALFVLGGVLVGIMVTVTQRSYKKDERSVHWVVYPTAKGERPVIPSQPGEWTLLIEDAGDKRIQVVKEIRALTKLGLAEAKALTDRTPSVVLSGVDHGTASTAYRVLANAGAAVRMTEAPAVGAPAAPAGIATPAVTGRFTVVVDDAGAKKIQVVKEIRAITQLGLAEAKRLVDVTPSTVLADVDHAAATAAHDRLTAAGAVARVAES